MRALKKQYRFQDEICDWIGSINMECKHVRSGYEIFHGIEISTKGKVVLVLKLIDLKSWIEISGAESELQAFAGRRQALSEDHIQGVVIWEDLWQYSSQIVKSRISALLGISQRIPARLTQVRRIDKQMASGFLNNNHLQGSVSSKTQYGLFLPERYYRVLGEPIKMAAPAGEWLVAVATFSHARVFYKGEIPFRSFEMIRFSNLLNTTVVGGLAKLIRCFATDFKPGDIMTYADMEWSDGASYTRLGFNHISDASPVHFLLDPHTGVRYGSKRGDVPAEGKISIINMGSRKFVLPFSDRAVQPETEI